MQPGLPLQFLKISVFLGVTRCSLVKCTVFEEPAASSIKVNTETVASSETSVHVCQAARCHASDDGNLLSRRCLNFIRCSLFRVSDLVQKQAVIVSCIRSRGQRDCWSDAALMFFGRIFLLYCVTKKL